MIKVKWVILQETENFITYIPLRLYLKIQRRIEKGKKAIVDPKKIRIKVKDPEKVSKIITKAMEGGK